MKETFEAKLKDIILHSIYPNSFYCLWLPPQGQSGGILIGLNEAKLDLKDVHSIAFSITVYLQKQFASGCYISLWTYSMLF